MIDMNKLMNSVRTLQGFVSLQQLAAMAEGVNSEESMFFIEKIQELADTFNTMPQTYEQDGKGDNAIAYLHYFHGGYDWYITERDMEAEQHQAFGLACIHEAELGYISLIELASNGVELDLHFKPATIGEIKRARAAA